MFLVLDMVPSG